MTTHTEKQMELAAKHGLRLCMAEGIPAMFHRWTEDVVCAVGDGSELYRRTWALVELPSGEMDAVEPHTIQFVEQMSGKNELRNKVLDGIMRNCENDLRE